MASQEDIPMSDIITRQPKADANGNQDRQLQEQQQQQPSLTGLGPLRSANQIKVKQKIRLKDVCGDICGCEAEKKYALQGPSGETLYWAKESSSCCDRCCLAEMRPLRIAVEDQTGAEVFSFRRPLNCAGCCCACCYPHCTQKIAVHRGGHGQGGFAGEEIGWIRERATWCFPVYHVFDTGGVQKFKVRGPLCHFCNCSDVHFSVTSSPSGVSVASITKKWLGVCRESALDADHFVVDFAEGAALEAEDKALVLSAVFLIDLMYYEGDNL